MGSNSPKQQRGKKQAPAPPKHLGSNDSSTLTNTSQLTSGHNSSLLSTSLIESTHSLSSSSSIHNVSMSGVGIGPDSSSLHHGSSSGSGRENNLMSKLTSMMIYYILIFVLIKFKIFGLFLFYEFDVL